MSLSTFARATGKKIQENSPVILTSIGVAGIATTAYVAHRTGYNSALTIVMEEDVREEGLTAKEKVNLLWKTYIPLSLITLTTAGCVIAATAIGNRRQATAMATIALGETAFREYRDKMVEVAGKQKDQKAIDELAKEKLEKAEGSEVVFLGDDKLLCFDTSSGRYFASNRMDIERCEIDFNRLILNNDYASLNEWYDAIGLDRVAGGDEVGWNNKTPLELQFTATLKGDKPALAISYRFLAFHDFDKYVN